MDNGKINEFSVIKKDPDLSAIIDDPSLSTEERYEVLDEKIESLETKKINMQAVMEKQDALYFDHSLNQKLHNSIFENEEKSNWNNLIYELNVKNILRK